MVLLKYAGRCYPREDSPCEQTLPQTWQLVVLGLVVVCYVAAIAYFHPSRPLARTAEAVFCKRTIEDAETMVCTNPACRAVVSAATITSWCTDTRDDFALQKEYAVWIEKETENTMWIEKIDEERYRRYSTVREVRYSGHGADEL